MERNTIDDISEKETQDVEKEDGLHEGKGQEAPLVESLSILSQRHRIPSWQLAALCRFMGWEDDKLVSDADFRAGLASLQHRRIGGGRM